MREAFRGVRFAAQGLLPAAGGTNDQTAAFIEAMEFIQAEENRIEREKGSHPFRDD